MRFQIAGGDALAKRVVGFVERAADEIDIVQLQANFAIVDGDDVSIILPSDMPFEHFAIAQYDELLLGGGV